MSARDKILGYLYWAVPGKDGEDAKKIASEMLDDFAHELAEEIRAMVFGRDDLDYEEKWLAYEAADLIDPKVKK